MAGRVVVRAQGVLMCSLKEAFMAGESNRDMSKGTEANVLLELRMLEPMSEEVLDANSDDVLEAVEAGVGDIALGPALALNVQEAAIKLRFDVLARDDAQVYEQVAKVLTVIQRDTDLEFRVSRSSVESHNVGAEEVSAVAFATT
jgi:hypothetical protein